MAKSSKSKSAKKRVKVKDLAAAEKKMTKKEMKKVKGGLLLPAVQKVMGVSLVGHDHYDEVREPIH